MKLLLDTHILVWSQLEPKKLSRRVAAVLHRSSSELWFSPINTWEILTLVQKGRLRLRPNAKAWIEQTYANGGLREAPLTQGVALALSELSLPHRDPADWFLAATAREYGLTLVTADTHLRDGRGFEILYNA